MVLIALAVSVEACIDSATTRCENGVVCPAGSTCNASLGCVLDAQLEACRDHGENDECTYGDVADARCIEGACVARSCGDGIVSGSEQCDGAISPSLASCEAHGFYVGGAVVTCTRGCAFDVSMCSGYCGDAILNGSEACDPGLPVTNGDDQLGGKTCKDFGFYAEYGLGCSSACTFVTDGCMHTCGDGVLDLGEDCDDAGTASTLDDVFAGDCRSQGFYSATTIRCKSNCRYDTSSCQGYCGDGILNGSEDCDDHNTATPNDDVFAGNCLDLGFYNATTIKCSPSCNYDDSSCTGYCGDRTIDASHAEQCESGPPPGEGCIDYGFESGGLGCLRGCGPDFSKCSHPWTSTDIGVTSTIYDVWGSSSTNVIAVGAFGVIRRWNGAFWSAMASGTTQYFLAVWGSSASDVFAVGNAGEIRHYNGTSWSAMPSASTTLYDVWGTGPSDVFAVGGGGLIVHYNGSSWSPMASGVSVNLYSVWGSSPADVFAVGGAGTILHYNGSTWSTMTSNTSAELWGVWGSGNNDVFAVGGGTVTHYNGSVWATQATGVSTNFRGVWGSGPNDVFAIADGPSIHWDGIAWTKLPDAAQIRGQLAAWGTGPADIWVVGGGASHWDGSSWFNMANTADYSVQSVWGAAFNDVFAVGVFGAIQRWNGTRWTAMTSNTGSNLTSVSGSSASDVFAVGTFGGLVHWNGSSWTPQSVTGEHLYGVWVRNATDAFTVGDHGVIFRWNGSAWSSMTSGTAQPLNSVWGNSGSDVWAVGNGGVILHWNGSTWTSVSSGTGQNLYGVWGSGANDVFAVGWFTIQHWNGSAWSTMSSPASPIWLGVHGTGPTDVFAVGQNGAIQHWDGYQWSLMQTPNPTATYNGVWAGADVFVAGSAKQILRRARYATPTEQKCHDGADDDWDGELDCTDSDCASDPTCATGGACTGATTLACDTSIAGTTAGAPSTMDAYDCDPWQELGREKVYRITPAVSGTVTVSLTGLGKDLDLVVLGEGAAGGCDVHAPGCLGASSTAGTSNESVTFTATAGNDYYLVVDGFASNAGAFTLDANCP